MRFFIVGRICEDTTVEASLKLQLLFFIVGRIGEETTMEASLKLQLLFSQPPLFRAMVQILTMHFFVISTCLF